MYDPKITITEQRIMEGNKVYIEGFMESDAEKPTENIAGGSNLFDFETGTPYFFKASSGEWVTSEEATPAESNGGE